MKTFVALILLCIVVFQPINTDAQCADPANIYSFTHDNRTYEVVKEFKSWTDAAACAVERGGYLVKIDNLEEQTVVYNAIVIGAAVANDYTVVSDGGGIAYVWIGATDKLTEGTWLWDGNNDDTGTNFWTGEGAAGSGGGSAQGGAYVNWGGTSAGTPNEPDNWSEQDAAGIALQGWPSGTNLYGSASEWNDIDISNTIYYVIEYDSSIGVIEYENSENDIKIYPNPADRYLFIESNNPANSVLAVSLIDVLGNTVIAKQMNGKEMCRIDMYDFEPGLYVAHINFVDGSKIVKKVLLR